MPETMQGAGSFLSGDNDRVIEQVYEMLASLPGQCRELSADEVRYYKQRNVVKGWQLKVEFSDRQRRLNVLLNFRFPYDAPLFALVDRPEFLTWPHVEEDGFLCLLSEHDRIDSGNPAEVAKFLLGDACDLIEDCIAGGNRQDFIDEALVYWSKQPRPFSVPIRSLVTASGPSRLIKIWRGKKYTIVGNDEEIICNWLWHRFGEKNTEWQYEDALLLWLPTPLMPIEFPTSGKCIKEIASRADEPGVSLLMQLAAKSPSNLLVVLGAPTVNGVCFFGISIIHPRTSPSRKIGATFRIDLSKGFRAGKVPPAIKANRFLISTAVTPSNVTRMDFRWVHGREKDSRTNQLRTSHVVVLGCGSLGASVALILAKSGVGKLSLCDPDNLSWPNISRHPLGAPSVGENKAVALADHIKRSLPHIAEVHAYNKHWEYLEKEATPFDQATLVICAIGLWPSECALNFRHLQFGRKIPFVYGWMESHASATHAVAITASGGCFACNMNNYGESRYTVTRWSKDSRYREPGCGAEFTPYGAVELELAACQVAELAIDCLSGKVNESMTRIYSASADYITSQGGNWTDEWLEIAKQNGFQPRSTGQIKWPRNFGCSTCSNTGV